MDRAPRLSEAGADVQARPAKAAVRVPAPSNPNQAPAGARALWECFARKFAAQCSQVLQVPIHVRYCAIAMVSEMPAGAVPPCVEEPTAVFALNCGPKDARALLPVWLEISPAAALPMVQRLLGGAWEPSAACRALTSIERRLLSRVVEAAGRSLSDAWSGGGLTIAPGAPDAQAHGPAAPLAAVCVSFSVGLGASGGLMRLVVPASLMQSVSPGPADSPGGPMELSAGMPETSLSAQEAAQLAVGDVLATDLSVDGEVIIRVAGIPKFVGRLGQYDGRRAVTIVRRLE